MEPAGKKEAIRSWSSIGNFSKFEICLGGGVDGES
jgi:hypothetical protein